MIIMSIEHDITYKWQGDSSVISTIRKIIGAVESNLDEQVANGTSNAIASLSLTLSKMLSLYLVSDQPVAFKTGGTDAVQQVAITGSPTGGTFTLTFGAQTTTALAYNATATALQTALNLLSSIEGGVTCSGGPLPATPIGVTFGGVNGVQTVAGMTHTDSLTPSGAVAITTTTAGVGPDTTVNLLANVPLVWDSSAYYSQPFAANVSAVRISNASGAGANVSLRALSNP